MILRFKGRKENLMYVPSENFFSFLIKIRFTFFQEEDDIIGPLNKDFDFTRTFIDVNKGDDVTPDSEEGILFLCKPDLEKEEEEDQFFGELLQDTLKEAINKMSYRKISDEKIEQK